MVPSSAQLEDHEFAVAVHELVEAHPLWLAADRPIDDEDKLVLDILREVLATYAPPPPEGHLLYSVPVHDDPEVQALALVVPSFQQLSPEAAARSVRYLAARFGDEADHD